MIPIRKTRLLCLLAGGGVSLALFGSWTGSAGERTSIGEKIQFTEPETGAPDLPTNNPRERSFSRPFEFLDRGNSFGGVAAPLPLPGPNAVPM
jgi:hypothetical protein